MAGTRRIEGNLIDFPRAADGNLGTSFQDRWIQMTADQQPEGTAVAWLNLNDATLTPNSHVSTL